jgi:ABC-2 type transport system permease protein
MTATLQTPARLSPTRAVAHQFRYDVRAVLRNRQARFFSLAMPIGFLVLFCAIFSTSNLQVGSHLISESTYYVAGITTFGIFDVGFMTLVISLVEARESGALRRRQATPQPGWVIVAARILTALLTTGVTAVALLTIGRVAYGASVPLSALLPLATAVVVGTVAAVSLGFAASTIVRSSQAAQPVAMALAMPLFFISGVFVPWNDLPSWLRQASGLFPVRHVALAVLNPFLARPGTAGWSATDLLVVGAWAVGGLGVAMWRFRWSPQDL